jgi:hypothetical protein
MLVTNVMPHTSMRGYVKVFLRWDLVYRDFAALEKLTLQLPADEIDYKRIATEEIGEIAFMEITKRAENGSRARYMPTLDEFRDLHRG